ncbi:hypothetical protein [Haloarcula sediminis]|uniref:hypothetical protein n=1 Tax=Haloarcula sediminis TaxID=3111777 RepID=UPI002D76D1B8|nr:hypothetical protein [Haloarcula sp. CK38]
MALIWGFEAAQLAALLICGFAGGAFGAAIGALPAFCFTGFMVLVGEAGNVLGITAADGAAADAAGLAISGGGITGSLAFGPVFGPHVGFAGGVAAAAYAAKHDGMPVPDEGEYHPAKDIAYALGTRPDILAVGGVFGILGVAFRWTSQATLVLPVDPPAVGVIGTAVVARLVFGYPLVGSARGSGLLDMSPFENGTMRTSTDGGEVQTDGGTAESYRLAVEPWLPHQYKWSGVAMIGLVAGILGGYIAIVTGSPVLAFGVSAASLTFLNLGVAKFPVTHHMTLPGSFLAIMLTTPASETSASLAGFSDPAALIAAGAIGALGALVGEVVQRVFYAHSDTHFDPPAAAIIVTTLLLGLLSYAGILAGIGNIPGTV